jgi:hypothetical protein
VFTRVFPAAVAAASLMLSSAPVFAQSDPGARPNSGAGAPRGERVAPSRVNPRQEGQENRNQRNQRGRQAAAPTAEQNKTAAEGLIAATNSTCQATEVMLRGQIGEGQTVYEAACATGPGLILITSTPPQAVDCVALAGQADIARAADPAADVGLQCQIEINKDVLRVMTQFASEAGLACTVDQGAAVGKSSAGNMVYEVGCAGADGARIEKEASGWSKTTCFQVVSAGSTCRYTTAEEQAATLKTMFAGSAAAACDVTQARFMGSNANGGFYEAKCAQGDGLIARLDNANAVQQVYPCAEAAQIGGGCKLTTAPAAAAAPAAE